MPPGVPRPPGAEAPALRIRTAQLAPQGDRIYLIDQSGLVARLGDRASRRREPGQGSGPRSGLEPADVGRGLQPGASPRRKGPGRRRPRRHGDSARHRSAQGHRADQALERRGRKPGTRPGLLAQRPGSGNRLAARNDLHLVGRPANETPASLATPRTPWARDQSGLRPAGPATGDGDRSTRSSRSGTSSSSSKSWRVWDCQISC